MFGYFIIRKLFDISCISDHVQPISKPLSVVLAECGHFVVTWPVSNIHVVTWSVHEYSCTSCVHPGLCRNMPAESEPFDLRACSYMSYLVGYLRPDLCKSYNLSQ